MAYCSCGISLAKHSVTRGEQEFCLSLVGETDGVLESSRAGHLADRCPLVAALRAALLFPGREVLRVRQGVKGSREERDGG